MEREAAVDLLRGLVSIPSPSGQEGQASAWLVEQMRRAGFSRAYLDPVSNAVGELGPADAARVMVLLGHIDTVPGHIPVRVEDGPQGPVLYGRGSVDAKGPLAAFVAGAARLGPAWAEEARVRLVVVGAVEEESATSRGARAIRDRFNGTQEPVPAACVVGEPSGGSRLTLGYKGRLLVGVEAAQAMAHTAGPDAGVATVPVDIWNRLTAWADAFNRDRPRAFQQLQPSLRHICTWLDEAMQERVEARMGLRLPPDFPVDRLATHLLEWAGERMAADQVPTLPAPLGTLDARPVELTVAGSRGRLVLRLQGYEPAWRSPRNSPLVRAFLGAIRQVKGTRPAFVVKTGTSDMNVVGPAWRCPILAYGPGDSTLDHTPNEHLSLEEYWQAVQVLETALRRVVEQLPPMPAQLP